MEAETKAMPEEGFEQKSGIRRVLDNEEASEELMCYIFMFSCAAVAAAGVYIGYTLPKKIVEVLVKTLKKH